MTELKFFNPYADIRHTGNRLPHWQQEGAAYFITFRLADAVPTRLRNQWENEREAWLRVHPEPWNVEIEREYHQRFSGAIEQWLDAGHGACLLRRPDCAQIVAETLRHFEGERVAMISFVVMPNHVHALFIQNPVWPLEKLLQSWKRFITREINKLLQRTGISGSGITLIAWFATRSTSPIVSVTSGEILKRPDCLRTNLSFGKARRRAISFEASRSGDLKSPTHTKRAI